MFINIKDDNNFYITQNLKRPFVSDRWANILTYRKKL